MKAAVYHSYGSVDEINIEDVERPIPNENEVLIKVHAASVNSWDWDLVKGKPFIVRVLGGLSHPRNKILGADVAGIIAEVGDKVKKFKVGDAVLGDLSTGRWGGFAEYVSAPETALILKPDSLPFADAAALPQAGVLAHQGIMDYKSLNPGDKVLVNGAAGGVGTYAIQLAKLAGAEVTGVDAAEKLDFVKSVGADHVLDFRTEDFTTSGKQYDLILDVVANRSLAAYKNALRSGGVYVMIGGNMSTIFQCMFMGRWLSIGDSRALRLLPHEVINCNDSVRKSNYCGKIRD